MLCTGQISFMNEFSLYKTPKHSFLDINVQAKRKLKRELACT